MPKGNVKDAQYVVLVKSYTSLGGTFKGVRAVHIFDARVDAREFAAKKNAHARSNIHYVVQKVTAGPTSRK